MRIIMKIRTKNQKRLGGQKGQALVELAVIVSTLLLLGVAIIDVSNLLRSYYLLKWAVTEGARISTEATNQTGDSAARTAAISRIQRLLLDSGVSARGPVTADAQWRWRTVGSYSYGLFEVTATHQAPLFFAPVLQILGFPNLSPQLSARAVNYGNESMVTCSDGPCV